MATKKIAPKKKHHGLLDDAAYAMDKEYLSKEDAALLALELVAYLGWDKGDANCMVKIGDLYSFADGKNPYAEDE